MTGKHFKCYCVSCECYQHWGKIVQPKIRGLKMIRPSRTEWVAVMKIVCPIVCDWVGADLRINLLK